MFSLTDRLTIAYRALTGTFTGIMPQTAAGLLYGVAPKEIPARTSAEFLKAYSTMPHLRNVSHRIADSVASVKWELYAVKRGGRYRRMPGLRHEPLPIRKKLMAELKQADELVEIEQHPLLDALRGGMNRIITGYDLRFLTQLYLDIIGESFWIKERNGAGVPTSFWPVPPTWVKQTPTPRSPVYEVSFRGWQGLIPQEEMLWMKDPDPANPYGRGSGVAQSLADELEIDEFSSKHIKAWFYNDAMPAAVISPDDGKGWGSDIERIRQQWMDDHQGFWRKFKIKFSNRKVNVQELSQTFRDQQLIELRQHERDVIMQTLNIPPEMAGVLASSNRATIESSMFIYSTNVIVPRLERQREVYQEWLVPEYEDPDKLFIWYESPVPDDKEYNLKAMQAQPQAFTQNEWREAAGFDPRDDGEVFMMPFTVTPSTTLGGNMRRNGRQAASITQRSRSTGAAASLPSPPAQLKAVFVDDLPDDDSFILVHRVADRLTPRLQREFRRIIRTAKSQVDLALLEDALRQRLADVAEDAIPWQMITESLREASHNAFMQGITLAGTMAAEELGGRVGASIVFNQEMPHAANFASSHSSLLVTRINETSRAGIQQAISNAFSEGMAPDNAANLIRDKIGLLPQQESALDTFRLSLIDQGRSEAEIAWRVSSLSESMISRRSEMIARTEMIDTANEGQQLLWRQAIEDGVIDSQKARRYWLTALDDRLDTKVCEPIPFMNPDGRGMNEPFETSHGPIMRPTAHPNCRCTVTLQFKD